jgi:hypothetical protein
METKWKIALVLLALVAVSVVDTILVRNDFVRCENQLKAVVVDSQNVHASFTNGLKTQGLAVDKYGDMVIKALTATHGQGGSQAAVLLLQKQNPDIDASIIGKLQAVIEAGYARFEQVQRSKIDTLRVYRNKLESFPNNLIASTLNFPRVNLDEMEKIVTSADTKKAFSTGEMEPVNPFGK